MFAKTLKELFTEIEMDFFIDIHAAQVLTSRAFTSLPKTVSSEKRNRSNRGDRFQKSDASLESALQLYMSSVWFPPSIPLESFVY